MMRTPDAAGLRRIRFARPLLPPLDRVVAIYQEAYAAGRLTDGALVARFEAAAAERLQVRHAIAVSSGTAGLMLVLRALDLSGEVILPSFTFFATGHAVLWNGLTPVLADCDARTWNISPRDVEAKLTERTCAILGVHVYGNPADIEGLTRIAVKHELKLIFDAAHALGAHYRHAPIGRFGDAEVFSLSPTKLLVAGEGGLITTDSGTLAKRLRAARNHGNEGDYDPRVLGLNARMSEFHAALALAGLEDLEDRRARQSHVAALYKARLGAMSGITFPDVHPSDRATFSNASLLLEEQAFGLGRDRMVAGLRSRDIETRQYFSPPLHKQILFRHVGGNGSHHLPETDRIAAGVISMPCHLSLTDEDVDGVAAAFVEVKAAHDPGRRST